MTGFAAAAEDNSDKDGKAAAAGMATPGNSPPQVRPADSWLNLDKLDLNVYGFAYHPDRETVHRLHLDNEVNPGLGLHYDFRDTERGVTFAEVGAYKDSGSNLAKFASFGYQFKFGEHWKIGGALAVVQSQTYNDGVTFLGMFPLVTYDAGRVKLNAVYLPKFGEFNEVAAFGFYVSIPIGQRAR